MRKEKGEIFKTRKKGNNKDVKQYRRKKKKRNNPWPVNIVILTTKMVQDLLDIKQWVYYENRTRLFWQPVPVV